MIVIFCHNLRNIFLKNGYKMNLLNFDIYFKVQKKRCEFKITSLEIEFLPNFFHVIYENRIFLSLKNLQKTSENVDFSGFFDYVITFDYSSHNDCTKSMPTEAGCPLL